MPKSKRREEEKLLKYCWRPFHKQEFVQVHQWGWHLGIISTDLFGVESHWNNIETGQVLLNSQCSINGMCSLATETNYQTYFLFWSWQVYIFQPPCREELSPGSGQWNVAATMCVTCYDSWSFLLCWLTADKHSHLGSPYKEGQSQMAEGAWISKSLLGELPDDYEHSFRLLIESLIEINYCAKLLRLGGLSVTAANIILTNAQSLINII